MNVIDTVEEMALKAGIVTPSHYGLDVIAIIKYQLKHRFRKKRHQGIRISGVARGGAPPHHSEI